MGQKHFGADSLLAYRGVDIGRMRRGSCTFAGNALFSTVVSDTLAKEEKKKRKSRRGRGGGRREGKGEGGGERNLQKLSQPKPKWGE
jgi:hypothetical protein